MAAWWRIQEGCIRLWYHCTGHQRCDFCPTLDEHQDNRNTIVVYFPSEQLSLVLHIYHTACICIGLKLPSKAVYYFSTWYYQTQCTFMLITPTYLQCAWVLIFKLCYKSYLSPLAFFVSETTTSWCSDPQTGTRQAMHSVAHLKSLKECTHPPPWCPLIEQTTTSYCPYRISTHIVKERRHPIMKDVHSTMIDDVRICLSSYWAWCSVDG